MNVRLSQFQKVLVPGERSDIVATVRADVGPFRIHRVMIRKYHDTGDLVVTAPGRTTGGISIFRGSDEWQQIEEGAMELYNGRS